MSDFNSSLPIRTELNGDVAVKIVDGTTVSQALSIDASGRIVVKLDDGAGNLITSQANGGQRALDVGINVAGVQIDPRAIRALTSADVVTANQGAPNTNSNAWFARLTDGTNNVSALATGELKVAVTQALPTGTNTIGKVAQDNTTQWITSDLADGPVAAGTAASKSLLTGVQYNSTLPTLTAGQQAAIQADSSGRLLVGSIASALPAGTNNIGKVSVQDSTGAAITTLNPLPVSISASAPGSEIHDYLVSAAVAAAASANHDYTVTAAKTFKGEKFWASASGKIKMEVQISANGTVFTSKWVGFNSTSTPNISIDLGNFAVSDSGVGSKVRLIITNLDKQAMDVYSTISGVEI